jgi:hypothetical protein
MVTWFWVLYQNLFTITMSKLIEIYKLFNHTLNIKM